MLTGAQQDDADPKIFTAYQRTETLDFHPKVEEVIDRKTKYQSVDEETDSLFYHMTKYFAVCLTKSTR
jgi:hypothetical protein